MLKYSTEQLASLVALPIIIILLSWTVVIFHKNRRKWGPYDIPIVSVLILSILRNLTVLVYTLAIIFMFKEFNTEYCSVITWTFNSIHTFQASSLTSIAVIGLFSARLHRQSQNLHTFLTSTHIIYHLFCLTTLCACVGVAAILAQKDGGIGNVFAESFDLNPCTFLPFELDIKFNVFIIVLHVFLASISFISFLIICYNYYKIKKEGFDYIKKSNSDLSELSNNFHGINSNVNDSRGFYDTYTINRGVNNNYSNNKDTWTNNNFNNSEVLSNNSTTVSSTNSRRPCILKQQQEDEVEVEVRTTGLETMHPVLIVCYLFYHLPLMVLCIHPKLISPWSVAGIALWLGLVQDLLIPIGLGIVDSRFCTWVSDVYRCASKHTTEKLPQVGLDGKFRPFGLSSQPQSFDLGHHDRSKTLQQIEHRFPITNGSLYTSIDGRLPVIHNYRRHKEFRTGTLKQQDLLSSNVALHSSHISRRELESTPPQNYISCKNCEEDQCPSHSDLHHLSPQYVHRKLSFLQASQNNVFSSNGERKSGDNVLQINANQQNCGFVGNKRLQNTQNSFKRNQILLESSRQRNFPYAVNKRLSQSQESINHLYFGGGSGKEPRIGDQVFCHRSEMNIASPSFNLNTNLNNQMIKNSRNLVRLNKMRLSRSEESLTDFQFDVNIETSQNNQQTQLQPLQHNHTTFHHHQFSSDDEEYGFHENPDNHILKDYDSMSSSNSITTEANCDFEFFQVEKPFTRKVGDNADTSSNVSSEFYNQPAPSRPTQMRNYLSDKEKPKNVSNIRITRTNSKRSLENFQTFIEESLNAKNSEVRRNDDHVSKIIILHRSNSYTTLEDRKRRKKGKKSLSRSSSKASESYKADHIESHQKMKNKKNKSVEYLPNSAGKTVFIDDLSNTNSRGVKYVASSVPDFKKVFISEYI